MSRLYVYKFNFISLLSIFLSAVLLTACGGGSEDPSPVRDPGPGPTPVTRNITGTVAVGNPVQGTITIVDAEGNQETGQSDAMGAYSINVGGGLGPYLIRVVPTDPNLSPMYSYASGSGVANITPFTSLALVLAYQADLATALGNWTTEVANLTRTEIEQALATINANFAADLTTAGVQPTTYDFFTEPFAADGMGIDLFLESYNVSINYTNATYAITDSNQDPVNFVDSIDTAGYYIGAAFIPEGTGVWQLTLTRILDGAETTNIVQFPSSEVPWSEDRFKELFWVELNSIPTTVLTCDDDPEVNCEITIQVTQLDTSYNVTGDGGVGTEVTGSASYNWSATGYIQAVGFPAVDVNESHTWSFTWTWERLS